MIEGNILIVDQDNVHNFILEKIIRKATDYKIRTAVNEKEGVKCINKTFEKTHILPKVVFIGSGLLNGEYFISEIRNMYPDNDIHFVVMHLKDPRIEDKFKDKEVTFIEKPVIDANLVNNLMK